jgi:uncharacterized protein (DUF1800 family)
MGTVRGGGGPTRRTVLFTALATFAGVATARALGVRDLATGFAQRIARGDAPSMDPMDDPMAMPADPMDAADSEIIAAEASVMPSPAGAAPAQRPGATATTARTAAPSATAAPAALPDPGLVPPKVALGLDWISPLDDEKARVAHLLRRATFGATDADLDRAWGEGYARTVDRLLETPAAQPPALAAAEATPPMPVGANALQQWWIDWILKTPTPFAEAMTLFWHGHFTSDYRKGQTVPMYWQNRTWRSMSLGKIPDMVFQVTIDHAMLRYLDLATSTGRTPNENYARELMELFTMGVDTYTEDDVRGAAKALAGWRLPRATEDQRKGVFDPTRAYSGTVTFLGKTGPLDTKGVIDRIAAQSATATFLASDVVSSFVSPLASDAYVARIADGFRRGGYDVKALMRSVFQSPEFTSADSYRALVKSPTELMVSAAKAIGSQSLATAIAQAGNGMGQSLFDPPSVGGWPDSAAWISSNTMLARANYVSNVLNATRTLPSPASAVARHLDGVLGPETARALATATSDRQRWFVILASPEFQLK